MTVNLICSEKEKIVCSGGWRQWKNIEWVCCSSCQRGLQLFYGSLHDQMPARIWHLPCPIQDNFLQSLVMFPCREHWLSGLYGAKIAFEHNQKQLQQLKKKPKHTIQIFDITLALFTNCGYQMYRLKSHLIMQIIREPQWHELWYTYLSRSQNNKVAKFFEADLLSRQEGNHSKILPNQVECWGIPTMW